MNSKIAAAALICIAAVCVISAGGCENGEPEPGFDVTGMWVERGGKSTVEITEEGGFAFEFDPALSDGTTMQEGESFERVDNAHLNFRLFLGISPIRIVEVNASINSRHEMRFELDGENYCFVKKN
jgi:hypothetical protein